MSNFMASRYARRLGNALLALEIALGFSVETVIMTGLRSPFMQSNLSQGLDEAHLFVVSDEPSSRTRGPLTSRSEVPIETFRSLPGVVSVSLLSPPPFQNNSFPEYGGINVRQADWKPLWASEATAELVETLNAKLLEGKGFQPQDPHTMMSPQVLVTAGLAAMLDANESILGRRLVTSRSPAGAEIVGILQPFSLQGMAPNKDNGAIFLTRTHATHAFSRIVRIVPSMEHHFLREFGMLRARHPERFLRIKSFQESRREEIRYTLGAFGVSSVILIALPILVFLSTLSSVSVAVEQRSRRYGIQRALGARRRDVFWCVMRESWRPLAAGLLLGAAGALSAVHTLLSPPPPTGEVLAVGALVGIVFASTSTLAALKPAVQASRISPREVVK